MSPVLVTGGSGYVGTQLIAALLRDGRRVRAAVRSLEREGDVRAAVRRGAADDSGLEVVAAERTAWDFTERAGTVLITGPTSTAKRGDMESRTGSARFGVPANAFRSARTCRFRLLRQPVGWAVGSPQKKLAYGTGRRFGGGGCLVQCDSIHRTRGSGPGGDTGSTNPRT
jgi:hypothetical protein